MIPCDKGMLQLTGKQVSNKKQRDTAAADAEMERKRKAESDKENGAVPDSIGNNDILGGEDDKDVIF